MKTMRKIFAVILVLSMLMGMTVTAMADDEGSITITGTKANYTYKIYKMMNVIPVGEGGDTIYQYAPTDKWVDFFTTGGHGAEYGIVASNGYVIWKNTSLFASDASLQNNAVKALAVSASTYVDDHNIAYDTTVKTEGETVTIEGLDVNAYYLIKSSMGSAVMTGPIKSDGTITIQEKNVVGDAPTIHKGVGPNNAASMTVDVGAPFDYTITITLNKDVPAGTEITVTDIVPDYIYITENSSKVYLNDSTTPLTKGTDYQVQRNAADTPQTATHIFTFDKGYPAGTVLTLKYEGRLVHDYVSGNLEKVAANDGYSNRAILTIQDITLEDTATVYTRVLNGRKYYIHDQNGKTDLPGATFVLKNEEGKYYSIEMDKVIVEGEGESAVIGHVVTWVDSVDDATKMTSASDGTLQFFGIAEGKYTLIETVTPTGFTGAADTELELTAASQTVEIENVKGYGEVLPGTGGMGTTVLYLAGVALVLGAGVMMYVRKKQTEEE